MLKFSNIASFFKRNKKILYYTSFFVLLFVIGGGDAFAGDISSFFNSTPAAQSAQTQSVLDGLNSPVDKGMGGVQAGAVTPSTVGKNIIGWVNIVFIIAAMFVGILTQLVSLFLNPGWINGTIIGLDFYMKDIWILISNVVYFIFALLLIVIAFMNIIGKGDKWELKQALPKFIIGVLMVPFSWFMVQFILSISAILTVSAISLPFDTFPTMKVNGVASTYLTDKIIPEKCTINIGDKFSDKIKEAGKLTGTKAKEQASKILREAYSCTGKLSITDIMNDGGSIFSVIGIYTYGILKIDKFDTMTETDASVINTIVSLGVQGIINAIFLIVMLILLGALGLALFTRGVWLWLYAMFSPVFGLMYFFDKKEGGEGALGNFSFMEFIKLALVPVYVGAALSFGLMFIFVVISGLGLDNDKKLTGGHGINQSKEVKIEDNGATITLGKVSLTINGSILGNGSNKKKGESGSTILDILKGGVGSLIVGLLGIVVLWMSVMAALKSSKITAAVTQPIADFGKSIGELAMKSPQYLPIFGGVSAGGLRQIGSQTQTHFQNNSIQTGSDWIENNTSFGNGGVSSKMLANEIHNGSLNSDKVNRFKKEIAGKTMIELSNNSNSRDLVKALASKMSIDEDIIKGISSGNRAGMAKALYEINNSKKMPGYNPNRLYGSIPLSNFNPDFLDGKNKGNSPTNNTNGGGNKSGILPNNAGTYNLNFGNVKTILKPLEDNNGNVTGLNINDIKDLARSIREGFKGVELVSGLENLGFSNENDRKNILKEIGKYLKVNTSGKIIFDDSSTETSTGIDIDELVKGNIKTK